MFPKPESLLIEDEFIQLIEGTTPISLINSFDNFIINKNDAYNSIYELEASCLRFKPIPIILEKVIWYNKKNRNLLIVYKCYLNKDLSAFNLQDEYLGFGNKSIDEFDFEDFVFLQKGLPGCDFSHIYKKHPQFYENLNCYPQFKKAGYP